RLSAGEPADRRMDVHRHELPALDQLGVGISLVHLSIQQEPALAENVFGVDDAGRLLVLGYEPRRVDTLQEHGVVVVRDFDKLSSVDAVGPNLRDLWPITGVL